MNYINPKIASEVFYEGTGKDIRIHVDAIKYVTPKKTAQVIMNILSSKKIGPGTVLNMTGNYGGDTVPFLYHGWTGTVCEIDPEVAADLTYNLSQYTVGIKDRSIAGNINVYVGDAIQYVWHLHYLQMLEARGGTALNHGKNKSENSRVGINMFDLVFVDPPFGEQYRTYMDNSDDEDISSDNATSNTFVDPTLGGLYMADVIRLLKGITRNIVIKLPRVGDAAKNLIKELGHNEYSYDVYSPARLKALDPLHRNHKITLVFVTIKYYGMMDSNYSSNVED